MCKSGPSWAGPGIESGRKLQPIPVFLPGESHGWRSMVGYSPWGRKESDTTEQFSLSLSIQASYSQINNYNEGPISLGDFILGVMERIGYCLPRIHVSFSYNITHFSSDPPYRTQVHLIIWLTPPGHSDLFRNNKQHK